MRDKVWFRVLVGLAVALFGVASFSAPAQAGDTSFSVTKMPSPPSLAGKSPAPTKLATGSKHGVPAKKGGFSTRSITAGFHYAYAQETPAVPPTSMSANLLIVNPGGVSAGGHSLTEITFQWSGGGGYTDGIVELGIAVEPTAFGDYKTRVFGSCWVANVWQGSYTGGCGYVDNAANAVNLGADLTATGLNHVGTGKAFVIQYFPTTACGTDTDSIWIGYNGAWLGCYPTPGGANRLPAGMTTNQFRQAFGEVYKNGTSCYQMGNGTFPTLGPPAAGAYFSSLGNIGGPVGNFATYNSTDPTQYGIIPLSAANASFRYGGTESAPC